MLFGIDGKRLNLFNASSGDQINFSIWVTRPEATVTDPTTQAPAEVVCFDVQDETGATVKKFLVSVMALRDILGQM